MSIQSFSAVIPPARYDAVPWTAVRVYEAALPDAAFTQIAQVQVPADPSPDTPNPVPVTVTTATLDVGYYAFQFVDASGNTSPISPPVRAPALIGGALSYMPSVADMAALLRARTVDDGGHELGAFTSKTRPTDLQVATLIELAASEVATYINASFSDRYVESARSVIALRAAMLIEVSYFPEQTETRDSAFARFQAQYQTAVGELTQATGALGLILG